MTDRCFTWQRRSGTLCLLTASPLISPWQPPLSCKVTEEPCRSLWLQKSSLSIWWLEQVVSKAPSVSALAFDFQESGSVVKSLAVINSWSPLKLVHNSLFNLQFCSSWLIFTEPWKVQSPRDCLWNSLECPVFTPLKYQKNDTFHPVGTPILTLSI